MGKWMTKAHTILPQEDKAPHALTVSSLGQTNGPVRPNRRIQPPEPPLQNGWQVVWKNSEGELCEGRVHAMAWEFSRWVITLETGETLSAYQVRSVGRVENGKQVAAWSVKAHGLKGPASDDWQTAWRRVAALTEGLTEDDPRFASVLNLLDHCDTAFDQGNYLEFHGHLENIGNLLKQDR